MPAVDHAMAGTLYCGDNLEVLEEYVPDESVDLIYLDPPFNSQQTYNIVYEGSRAQEEAFKDFWAWEDVAGQYSRIVDSPKVPQRLRRLLRALHELLIDEDSDLLAYLTMMAPRLVALHRVLKPSGSLYLHCDPTASHYLKMLLDCTFGGRNFNNEVIWLRAVPKSDFRQGATNWPRVHDVLLCHAKDVLQFRFEQPFAPHSAEYVATKYKQKDADGRHYQLTSLIAPGNGTRGHPQYELMGVTRYWRYNETKMQQLVAAGRVVQPSAGAVPRYKRYLDEMAGVPIGDVWADIPPVNSQADERIGYPTQKPVALLERILRASSKEGDLVLDPFCGCGTTIEACERLGRRWIGIDIAAKAVEVTETRFNRLELDPPEVVWHPVEPDAARKLARNGKAFERWALLKVRAARLRKYDRGIDGDAYFRDSDGTTHHVVVSVKGVKQPNPAMVRELRGTLEREKAGIGVLVLAAEPSKEMLREATRAGHLPVSDSEGAIPRLQLVTLERLFSDLPAIRCPGVNCTEMPRKVVPTGQTQLSLDLSTTQAANDRHAPEKPMPIRNARPRGASGRKSAAK